jgi:hypothetical protein
VDAEEEVDDDDAEEITGIPQQRGAAAISSMRSCMPRQDTDAVMNLRTPCCTTALRALCIICRAQLSRGCKGVAEPQWPAGDFCWAPFMRSQRAPCLVACKTICDKSYDIKNIRLAQGPTRQIFQNVIAELRSKGRRDITVLLLGEQAVKHAAVGASLINPVQYILL